LLRVSLAAGRQHFRYGGFLAAEGLASNLVRQSDVFVGGLFLNAGSIGLYSVPRDLNMRIAMIVNPIITRIGFPLMSRMKSDKPRLRVLYLQALKMTASVNFPIYLAMVILAPDIVQLLYGARWAAATPYLRILAAWGLIRSLGNPVGSLLYATGRAEFAFWWNVGLLAVSAAAFWLGSILYGVMGLTLAALLIQVLLFWPIWKFMVHPACGASFRDYMTNIAPPLLVGVTASSLAWLSVGPLDPGLERLVMGCTVGGVAYGALSLIFNRTWADAMREILSRPRRAS
jgi:O-antigen/teichoic acid export membrane protein